MNYEIIIQNSLNPDGEIEFQQLALLAKSMRKIAEGALHLRLNGLSVQKGKNRHSLDQALRIHLKSIGKGSSVLNVSSKPFRETLTEVQLDLFRQESQDTIPDHTPVSLFIETLTTALDEKASKEYLDKPLLQELTRFKSVFGSEKEVITFQNQGSLPPLSITKKSFHSIKVLEDALPEPERVYLVGQLESLHYTTSKVIIRMENSIIEGIIPDSLDKLEIAGYWGMKVSVYGVQHHRASKKAVVEIEKISIADESDSYFGRRIEQLSIEQQIAEQLLAGKYRNPIALVAGQWPGDESIKELIGMIKE